MGYQESFVQVSDLAEAAGIRRAVREHEDREWFDYVCCECARQDVRFGAPTWWGWGSQETMPTGTLLVVVSGGRHPYQHCGGRWSPIDAVVGLTSDNYYEHFRQLDEGLVDAGWNERPAEAEHAYDVWSRYLDTIWDEGIYGKDYFREVCEGSGVRATPA